VFFLIREETASKTVESHKLKQQLLKELKPFSQPEFAALREKLISQKIAPSSPKLMLIQTNKNLGLISDSPPT
jgi:hypothetical protein